jgi:hypothetical protein
LDWLVVAEGFLAVCMIKLTDRAVLTVLFYQVALLVEVQVTELLHHSVSAEIVLLIMRKLKDIFDKAVQNTESLCTVLSCVI